MVTCHSANRLKTPAKVSWAFKMLSQFGSLGYTIMEKTTDLTVVQKTIIDTLHKEGKPQTFIAKEAGSQPYEDCHAKSIQEFGWTSQGMDWGWGQGIKSTTHRRVKEFGYSCLQRRLTWAKEKNWTVAQWSKVLFSDESKFCISFGNKVLESGGRVEKLIAQVAWSPVLSFHSLWWFGVQCHLLVLVHCVFLKTNVTAPVYQDILEHFMLPSDDQLFKDADFIFQQGFAPAHTAKSTKSWLNDHGVTVLDWPANSPDLNPIEIQDTTMQMTWRPLSKQPGLPLHLSSATDWSPPCHATLMQ